MKMISGTFNGIGAAAYLCLGFIPDQLRIVAVEDSEVADLWWTINNRAAETDNGWMNHGGAQTVSALTAGTGVEPYEGADTLSATEQTNVTYGGGIYLGWDIQNYAQNGSYGGASEKLTAWTLGSSTNRTGNFNDDLAASGTTRIGEGSRILIGPTSSPQAKKWTLIEACAAAAGGAANEVTLARAIASGKIEYISGMYSMAPIAIGDVTPAGIKLNLYTDINVDDEIQMFTATVFDNAF